MPFRKYTLVAHASESIIYYLSYNNSRLITEVNLLDL